MHIKDCRVVPETLQVLCAVNSVPIFYHLLHEAVDNFIVLICLSHFVAFLPSSSFHLFLLLQLMPHYNACHLYYCIFPFLLKHVKSVKAEYELNIVIILSILHLLICCIVIDASLTSKFFLIIIVIINT